MDSISDNSVDRIGELANHEYFSETVNNLDFVMDKVKTKKKE